MKKIIYYFGILAFLASCEANSDNQETQIEGNSGEGRGGSLASFTIRTNHLYAVDAFGLNVFNITNPENPVQVNTIPIGFDIETIFSYKQYLYIGSQNGMFIYSIENPESPVYLADVQHFTACDPVIANENTAFVTLWSDLGCGTTVNQLEIYDVTEITSPILLNVRNLTFPKGMGLYREYLFVCDDEIKIFDISTPKNTTLVHTIDRLAFDVIHFQ